MQKESIRSFFACDFSNENLKRIDRISADLKSTIPNLVRWVITDNIHLTMKFIGEFKPDDIEKTRSLLNQKLNTLTQFDIEINHMGVFPSYAKPRVIWIGINQDDRLIQLVKIINQVTEQMGYPTENRPFSAHITLGRVRDNIPSEKLKTIGSVIKSGENCTIGSQKVHEVCFFQSQLTPQGSIYKKIFIVPLNG